jgi:hypothetical protein
MGDAFTRARWRDRCRSGAWVRSASGTGVSRRRSSGSWATAPPSSSKRVRPTTLMADDLVLHTKAKHLAHRLHRISWWGIR